MKKFRGSISMDRRQNSKLTVRRDKVPKDSETDMITIFTITSPYCPYTPDFLNYKTIPEIAVIGDKVVKSFLENSILHGVNLNTRGLQCKSILPPEIAVNVGDKVVVKRFLETTKFVYGANLTTGSEGVFPSKCIDKIMLSNVLNHTRLKSDHMYRMSILSMLVPSHPNISSQKLIKMSLVHDIAESLAGDISPAMNISKADKYKIEKEALDRLLEPLLMSASGVAGEIVSLWNEYEEGVSEEAVVVKDLDKFEMLAQAVEYERREQDRGLDLDSFFESTKGKFKTEFVKGLVNDLYREREELKLTKTKLNKPNF